MIPLTTLIVLGRSIAKALNSSNVSDNLNAVQNRVEQDRINVEDVYAKWAKSYSLFSSGILTADEYGKQKSMLISAVERNGIRQRPLDALGQLLPLIRNGAITVEEAKVLKSIFRGGLPVPGRSVCKNCNITIEVGSKFCGNCGNSIV